MTVLFGGLFYFRRMESGFADIIYPFHLSPFTCYLSLFTFYGHEAMSDPVIKVENLSKLYHLGELHRQTNSFRDRVTHTFKRLVSGIKNNASSSRSG